MNEDEFVEASLSYNELSKALELKVKAKRAVTLTELQGSRKLLNAYGATMPPEFHMRQFGENVEIPDVMKDEIEFMNKAEFRWGAAILLTPGSERVISLPASGGEGVDKGLVTLAYEYPKLFGLLKGKGGIHIRYARD